MTARTRRRVLGAARAGYETRWRVANAARTVLSAAAAVGVQRAATWSRA